MKSENCQKFSCEQGPSIAVHFYVAKRTIHHISLFPSSKKGLEWHIDADQLHQPLSELICRWMKEYSLGKEPLTSLPCSLEGLPPFTLSVLRTLQPIPFGQTLSYQEVAAKIGSPKAARAVGGACGRNPFPLVIPCHRVLAAGHRLGGFSAGLLVKQRLLAFESVYLNGVDF